MDFLINLFWFPINSIEFLFNIALWALLVYMIYEGIRKYKEQQQGLRLGQGQGIDLIQRGQFILALVVQTAFPSRQIFWEYIMKLLLVKILVGIMLIDELLVLGFIVLTR